MPGPRITAQQLEQHQRHRLLRQIMKGDSSGSGAKDGANDSVKTSKNKNKGSSSSKNKNNGTSSKGTSKGTSKGREKRVGLGAWLKKNNMSGSMNIGISMMSKGSRSDHTSGYTKGGGNSKGSIGNSSRYGSASTRDSCNKSVSSSRTAKTVASTEESSFSVSELAGPSTAPSTPSALSTLSTHSLPPLSASKNVTPGSSSKRRTNNHNHNDTHNENINVSVSVSLHDAVNVDVSSNVNGSNSNNNQRRRHKNVRFHSDRNLVSVRRIAGLDSYSNDEWGACFYSRPEFDAITQKAHKVIAKYTKQFHKAKQTDGRRRSNESGDDGIPTTDPSSLFNYTSSNKKLCIRGLEKFFTQRQNEVDDIRIKAIDIVMDIQDEQWQWGHDDGNEQIAKQYHQCTKHCLLQAQERANHDARAIQKYIKRSRSRSMDRIQHQDPANDAPAKPLHLFMEQQTSSLVPTDDDEDTIVTAESDLLDTVPLHRPLADVRDPTRRRRPQLPQQAKLIAMQRRLSEEIERFDPNLLLATKDDCARDAAPRARRNAVVVLTKSEMKRSMAPGQVKITKDVRRNLSQQIVQFDAKKLKQMVRSNQ